MSDVDQSTPQDSLEVEITDLDPVEHAGHTLPTRLVRMLLRWQQPERRRLRRWLSNGLLICLALALLVALLNPSVGISGLLSAYWSALQGPPSLSVTSNSSISVRQVLAPASDEIHCPIATAWSPDSSTVALLGYTQACAQDQYIPAQINVYDAATARQMANWSPDGAILHVLQSYPGVSPSMEKYLARKPNFSTDHGTTPVIHYLHVLWSPDHARLALSFVAVNYVFAYAGLFLANTNGSQAQVLLEPEHVGLAPNASTPLLWDLQNKSVTTLAALPPALAYTWDGHDQLVPAHPLDAHTDVSDYASAAPGSPVGAQAFTIWQPGHVTIQASGVYLWSTRFAAWSPDGRYFVTNFAFSGLMEPPGQAFPSAPSLQALGLEDIPHMPAHDPALLFSPSTSGNIVAWNPTGTLLAVYYDLAGAVNLYDCQTGDLVQQLDTGKRTQSLAGSTPLLSWSPDGHSLLFSSSQGKLITLWHGSSLLH